MNLKSFLLKIAIPIIILTAGTDRILKAYILNSLRSIPQKSVTVTSFFNITEVWNYGISFGLLKTSTVSETILLLILTLIITGFLTVLLLKSQTRLEMVAFACIIGGALGNLFDRIYYGKVYDFLDFHFNNIHFWTFNPADVFISVGAFLLIYDQIMIYFSKSKHIQLSDTQENNKPNNKQGF